MAALLLAGKPCCISPKPSNLNQTRPHILAGDIEMYSLFDHPADGLPYVVQSRLTFSSFEEHQRNLRLVEQYVPDEGKFAYFQRLWRTARA